MLISNSKPLLRKYHALGNDYWVCWGQAWEPAKVAALCDRHRGLGADGLLVVPSPTYQAQPLELLIYNADGSQAQSSGNGLRIFGAFLADQKHLEVGKSVQVKVAGINKSITLLEYDPPRSFLEVDLGQPSKVELKTFTTQEGVLIELHTVSLGNPHCVVFVPEPTAQGAQTLGPQLEHLTPERTNVQCVQVLAPDRIRLEIWERGSGYTLASGSSAAAAVAVAQFQGLCGPQVQAHMPGGVLHLHRNQEGNILLRGPVQAIAQALWL